MAHHPLKLEPHSWKRMIAHATIGKSSQMHDHTGLKQFEMKAQIPHRGNSNAMVEAKIENKDIVVIMKHVLNRASNRTNALC